MEIPLHPPASWFDHPGAIPTDRRITIQPDGRVFGYVKLRGSCHTGMPGCVDAPDDSPSDFGFAHQGRTLTAEGHEIATAVLAGGTKRHASLASDVDIIRAAAHYQEGVENQLMRVRYGSDDNGIWFSGALWPDADPLAVEHIRASPNSGDWRYVSFGRKGGGHDFAGAVLVNIPGFAMANAGGSRSMAGNIEAIAASSGFGLDSSGNIFELYAQDKPPVKETPMCQSCSCNPSQPPVTASPGAECTCEKQKQTCDCAGKNKAAYPAVVAALIAAADGGEDGKAVTFEEAVVMKLDEFSAHFAALDEVVNTLAASRVAESLMA